MKEKTKTRSFTHLKAWQYAHKYALSVYQICGSFPRDELYGLTAQLKRAALSVPSNIAEGFNRFSDKEKINFYYIALGSLTETQSQLLLAKDLKYVSNLDFKKLAEESQTAQRVLNGLIRAIKKS